MPMLGSSPAPRQAIWKRQNPVDYLDTSLVQDAWETVSSDLSEGKPARLQYIIVEQTNNGATQENVELEITINGVAYTVDLGAIASGERRYVYHNVALTGGVSEFSDSSTQFSVGDNGLSSDKGIPFVAESVGQIRVRQTSNVDGVSAQLEVNIVWDKLTAVIA